jgi:hypothetical protein
MLQSAHRVLKLLILGQSYLCLMDDVGGSYKQYEHMGHGLLLAQECVERTIDA